MKGYRIFLNSETLQLSVEKCDTKKDFSDLTKGLIIFRSYPDTVELKEFNFECINECGDKWETKSFGSDVRDAIGNFRLLYPNDKIIAVTE